MHITHSDVPERCKDDDESQRLKMANSPLPPQIP